MIRLFSILLLAAPAFANAEEKIHTLPTERFGVKLGSKIETVIAECTKLGISIHDKQYTFTDPDHPNIIYNFAGALNRNKAIKETQLTVFNGRICAIRVEFLDSSQTNTDVIKGALGRKYGEQRGDLADVMESKFVYTTDDDDHKVTVVLNRDLKFGAPNNAILLLAYVHSNAAVMVFEEIQRRKAAKIEDDL